MKPEAAARSAGEADAASCPTLARFLARHPALAAPVAELLAAAAAVRAAREAALPPPAAAVPPPSRAWTEHGAGAAAAVAELAALAAAEEDPEAAAVGAGLRQVTRALLVLRAESHGFAPPRSSRDPAARAALLAALDAYGNAWRGLGIAAAAAHVRRLPWQLELATHVPPGAPMAHLAFDGYDLPRTRAAERSWGERCCLTGTQWTTDSRASPGLRYRSLDACSHTLSPAAMELVGRLRHALLALSRRCPAAGGGVGGLVRLFPWIAGRHLPESASAGFQRLGLLDYPAQSVALNNVLLAFAARPLFGARGGGGVWPELGCADPATRLTAESTGDGAGGETPYRWTTFASAREQALRLAWWLDSHGPRPGGRLGILASGPCVEVHLADFAAIFGGLVSVVLPATASVEVLRALLARQRIDLLVAESAALAPLADAAAGGEGPPLPPALTFGAPAPVPGLASPGVERLAAVLAASDPPAGWRSASGIAPTTGIIFGDRDGYAAADAEGIAADADDALYSLLWSSGSTREPAPIPVTRRRWIEEMCPEAGLWPLVGVSFQAPWSAADRGAVWRALTNGGRVGFARAGAAFFSDLEALRPTALDAPPVVWRALHAEYRRAVADPDLPPAAAAAARQRLRQRLGGRLAFAAIGGAASEPALRENLSRLLEVPLHDSYGTTETGNIGVDGRLAPGLDYRLLDVAELGLAGGDLPHPRGELVVRAPRGESAAAAEPERTTEDGYFRTGDLVELLPGNRFRVIGRRRHVLKLASGEWVAPEELERTYAESELVEAVLVTASPLAERVVAVVVPAAPSIGERELLADLRRIARRHGLRPGSVPAAVVIAPRQQGGLPWTVDNGLLTATLKPNRVALEQRYRGEVEAAYDRAAARVVAAADDAAGDVAGALPRLLRLAAVLLARPLDELDPQRSFAELGGDSLAAMELELRLAEVFAGAAVNADDRDGALATLPLAELARRLDASQLAAVGADRVVRPLEPAATAAAPAGSDGDLPSALRGDGGHLTVADEIAALATGDAAEPVGPPHLPPATTREDVLVTGANGFLGSHLVAHLAATLPAGVRIWAMLRAASHQHAAERMREALRARLLPAGGVVGPETAQGRVVAVAGSLVEAQLGLAPALYARLAREVGLIHHVAAEVAFDRSYTELRAANVLGTRRVLDLATDTTLKALHLVSTLNVFFLLRQLHGSRAIESTPLPDRVDGRLVAGNLGYTVSKWAAERLVDGLFRRAGGAFRASISRPALLVWSRATGIGNDDDWLSRSLASCLHLRRLIGPDEVTVPRWAPETPLSARGLDLVPVDYAARGVAALGRLTSAGGLPASAPGQVPAFHVSNNSPGEAGLVTLEHLMNRLALSLAGGHEPPLDWRFLPLAEWALAAEVGGGPVLPVLHRLRQGWPRQERTPAAAFTAAFPEPCPPFDQGSIDAWCRGRGAPSGASPLRG